MNRTLLCCLNMCNNSLLITWQAAQEMVGKASSEDDMYD